MVIKAITHNLHREIHDNEAFSLLFSLAISALSDIVTKESFNDYCVFIKLIPTNDCTEIIFDDGGATFNEELQELEYTTYSRLVAQYPLNKKYTLYYSVHEQILCFLDER